MHTKIRTIITIFIHYVIAIGILAFVFFSIDLNNFILDILVANVLATLYIYIVGMIYKNASFYDPYWSVMPPVILMGFSFILGVFWEPHIILLNLAVFIWAIRLTYNWARLWKDFSHEDWRYVMIREKFPKIYPISNLLGIHLFPTLIVYIQLIGGLYYITFSQGIELIALLGFVVIVCAVYIQFVSDQQMYNFKKKHPLKIMNQGLWAFSRHPNYFGEIMVWIGVYLFYLSAIKTIDLQLLSPVAMILMFVSISIPMLEKKMLRHKPDYKNYQESVSMLIILPSNKEAMSKVNVS